MPEAASIFSPFRWKDGALLLIDQRQLPRDEVWLRLTSAEEAARAIRDMMVRGAPAIGCTAAYGLALAAHGLAARTPPPSPIEVRAELDRVSEMLAATRPTAVNLFWALSQMRDAALIAMETDGVAGVATALEQRAQAIHREDIARCRAIGKAGAELVPDRATVLTHCNTGALATGGYGTALGVIRAAREAGKQVRVLADETRPFLQGARLTAWELMREGFEVTIIPDSAAAFLMRRGEVDCAIVGADRIAANGDVANKIGTYGVALAAAANHVPFYVAAPLSTIDLETATGASIPIEERSGSEMLTIGEAQIAPRGAMARYPAFDVTPNELVSAVITDNGIARPPYGSSLARAVQSE